MISTTSLMERTALRGIDYVRIGKFVPAGVFGLDIALIKPDTGFLWHTLKGIRQITVS